MNANISKHKKLELYLNPHLTPFYFFKRNFHLGSGLTDFNVGTDLSLKMRIYDLANKKQLFSCVEEKLSFGTKLARRLFKNLVTDYKLNVYGQDGRSNYLVSKLVENKNVTVSDLTKNEENVFEFRQKVDTSCTIVVLHKKEKVGYIKEYLISWNFDLFDNNNKRVGKVVIPGIWNKFFTHKYLLYLSEKSESNWTFFSPLAVELLANKSK